jgi:hypothetical protein
MKCFWRSSFSSYHPSKPKRWPGSLICPVLVFRYANGGRPEGDLGVPFLRKGDAIAYAGRRKKKLDDMRVLHLLDARRTSRRRETVGRGIRRLHLLDYAILHVKSLDCRPSFHGAVIRVLPPKRARMFVACRVGLELERRDELLLPVEADDPIGRSIGQGGDKSGVHGRRLQMRELDLRNSSCFLRIASKRSPLLAQCLPRRAPVGRIPTVRTAHRTWPAPTRAARPRSRRAAGALGFA